MGERYDHHRRIIQRYRRGPEKSGFLVSGRREMDRAALQVCGPLDLQGGDVSEFVEVKTKDLSGVALDWAVAKAEGVAVVTDPNSPSCRQMVEDAEAINGWYCYSPSTDWSQGGPLIEKHAVTLTPFAISFGGSPSYWLVQPWDQNCFPVCGSTPLIAACRAIAASVLGDTVKVPKELLS
ncbi:DUF2591 domain-containing protein [Pseudomonas sp. WMBT8]|uniref:DUF2591 domain-containing protein n=1 Tax=Pseudomonas sp. WMBT8 TaxID=3414496 RepID=UPI003D8073F7